MSECHSMFLHVSMNMWQWKSEDIWVLSMFMCKCKSLYLWIHEFLCSFMSECVSMCIHVNTFMCENQGMSKLVCVKVLRIIIFLNATEYVSKFMHWARCKILSEVLSVCGCAFVHELICKQVHFSEYVNMFVGACLYIYIITCSWGSTWVCVWLNIIMYTYETFFCVKCLWSLSAIFSRASFNKWDWY